MRVIRRSAERGHAMHGWLNTYHTFSFANYDDPDWRGFGPLRVINEDRIEGKAGFDEHFHHDMEILTYVIEGALQHRDSLGNGSIIRPNQIQYMSAGTGILHSEFNPEEASVHLLQIWIEPNVFHVAPRYQEKSLTEATAGVLQLLASSEGREDSIQIRQDADVFRGLFQEGEKATLTLRSQRMQWIQIIEGELAIGDEILNAGDACGFQQESEISFSARTLAHILFFDLAS